MPVSQFFRELSIQSGISSVVAEELDLKTVTLEVVRQPVEEVLALVSRRLGVRYRKQGSLYFFGKLSSEDKGVLVRRVRRMSPDKIQEIVKVFLSGNGRVSVLSDGLLVLGDSVEILARVDSMLSQVEAVSSPLWVVQLHLVSWSGRAAQDYGIDVTPAAKVALGFAAGSAAGSVNGFKWDLSADLDNILKFANTSNQVSIVASPQFLLNDGETSKFVSGDRVPIPRRVTSDQGTTRTEGFDFIETGINIACELREMSENSARLKLDIEISDIQGYLQEEIPITGQEQFSTTATVQAGGIYLLGTLEKKREDAGDYVGFHHGKKQGANIELVQICLQIYRVSGGFEPESPQLPLSSSPSALRPALESPR